MHDPEMLKSAVRALLAEGKNPSVAHLKAKLGATTPLPVLINLVQQYKASPELFTPQAQQPKQADAKPEPDTSAPSPLPASRHTEPELLTAIHSELQQIRQLLQRLVER